MLSFSLDAETGILAVKEVMLLASKSVVRYWYYDTRKWLKSSCGKQGDVPDRAMSEADIKWVKQYYLPKVSAVAA